MKIEGIPQNLKHEHDLSVTVKLDVDMKDTINDIVYNTACVTVCAVGVVLLMRKVFR